MHVWEFLRDLLKDEKCETMIRWLDMKKGIFKIVDPDQVSNKWGERKANKTKMSYPNMARGIRYYLIAIGNFLFYRIFSYIL